MSKIWTYLIMGAVMFVLAASILLAGCVGYYHICPDVVISPANPSIINGQTQQFTVIYYADGTPLVNQHPEQAASHTFWTSSNTGVATISNEAGSNGLATSIAPGTTTITGTDTSCDSGKGASTILTVQ